MVYALDDLTTAGQALAGGKGGTLAQLRQAGYPVPDGFVVLPAAMRLCTGDQVQVDGGQGTVEIL